MGATQLLGGPAGYPLGSGRQAQALGRRGRLELSGATRSGPRRRRGRDEPLRCAATVGDRRLLRLPTPNRAAPATAPASPEDGQHPGPHHTVTFAWPVSARGVAGAGPPPSDSESCLMMPGHRPGTASESPPGVPRRRGQAVSELERSGNRGRRRGTWEQRRLSADGARHGVPPSPSGDSSMPR
jgi:hypothetical protein